jgi:hypothetical protein
MRTIYTNATEVAETPFIDSVKNHAWAIAAILAFCASVLPFLP